jgi:hypothetical protein
LIHLQKWNTINYGKKGHVVSNIFRAMATPSIEVIDRGELDIFLLGMNIFCSQRPSPTLQKNAIDFVVLHFHHVRAKNRLQPLSFDSRHL